MNTPGRTFVALAVLTLLATVTAPGFDLEHVHGSTAGAGPTATAAQDAPALDSLRRLVRRREQAVAAGAPHRSYIVIDRANNRLWVRRRGEVALEAVVSTGSGTVLQEAGGLRRTWTFDTPSGRFEVLAERPNPVWTKPDWAFLEEGQQPPATLRERREKGSLGEWALDLGDGYMIHGTLYERLLGRSLTHGCIRVGREDLRAVARAASPGTPVYIF